MAFAGCATAASGVVFVDLDRGGVRKSDAPGAANVVALDLEVGDRKQSYRYAFGVERAVQ